MKSVGVAIGESPPPPSLKIQYAGVAQQVERFTCNEDVAGSIPVASSIGLGSSLQLPQGVKSL